MTWRRGEAGSTLIDRPNDAPVPDFHEWQGRDILYAGASREVQILINNTNVITL